VNAPTRSEQQTPGNKNDQADEHVPAAGRQLTITVNHEGVQREVSILVPSRYVPDTAMPLLFALHGGSGDASVMYAEEKRIVSHAESDGFIAVFPNGLPKPDKPDSRNYFWEDPVNHNYMAFLMDELSARYTIDTGRIYFIGFSGGARLIYDLASDLSANRWHRDGRGSRRSGGQRLRLVGRCYAGFSRQ
jgi:poly(3-hydroxybutyrate) depolymerase